MSQQSSLRALLQQSLGCSVQALAAVGGGDINDAWRVTLTDGRQYFVKYNASAPPSMFAAEARGLDFLRGAGTGLVIPQVIAIAEQFLVLELLTPSSDISAELLGRGLAQQHQNAAPAFGLDHDNFIGTLPQKNASRSDWVSFYREQRLAVQLSLPGARRAFDAAERAVFDRLLDRLDELLGPPEPPARLHGDLWGGNWMATKAGPALFDPAVYGGHREVDLAMMQLFGGFPQRAFEAYDEVYPLAPEARGRVRLYQLYPLLVHANLFGGGYAASAFRIAQDFV